MIKLTLHAQFFSNCLRKWTEFTAVLPDPVADGSPEVSSEPGKFKTLYLLHGYTGNCSDWLLNSKIQELANLHHIAVIMPSGDNGFYVDNITGANYGEFTGKEIVDVTRAYFPLSHQREDTLIGGLSMGGFGALRNGLKYSETFGTIIALSSALITDQVAKSHGDMKGAPENKEYYVSVFGDPEKLPESENEPKHLAHQLKASHKPIPKIYMACGTEDFLNQPNRDMHQYLTEMGIDVTYVEAPGIHDWNFWRPQIESALNWFEKG